MINFYKDNQTYVWSNILGIVMSFYILHDIIANGNVFINAWVTTTLVLIVLIGDGIFLAAMFALYQIENIKRCSCGVKK